MLRDEATSARKRDKSHLQISGTYPYSSWERVQAEMVGQEAEPSIADSLSRLFELESNQVDESADAGNKYFKHDLSLVKTVVPLITSVKEEAKVLRDLALLSCSTSANSTQVYQVSESLQSNLSHIESLLAITE